MSPSKTRRRDAGSGGLYQDSRGLWTAVVELPAVGDERRRKVIRSKDKAVAARKLKEVRAELDRAGDLATSSPTVAVWMRTWLDRIARPRLKPRTFETYEGYVDRYIVPAIGKIRLDKLTTAHVRKVHEQVTVVSGLSSTTALQAHRILAKSLTDAMREGRVSRNVATLTDAPRKAVSTRGALVSDHARALLVSVANDETAAAQWSIALLTGMRQGERLGLTRDAIDLDAGVITVSWQLQRLRWEHGCGARRSDRTWPCGKSRGGSCPDRHLDVPAGQEAKRVYGGLWLTRPKSRAGWREVPMPPLLAEVMTRYLASHQPGDEGLIFVRTDRHPIDPRDDSAAWDRALRDAGLPDVVLHSARHTTATLLLELGVPEKVRVQIMGHSSATTTAGYTHVADPLMRDALGRLGTLLAPQIEGP
jgi:integrase